MQILITSKSKFVSFTKQLKKQPVGSLFGKWVGIHLLVSDRAYSEKYGYLHELFIDVGNPGEWWISGINDRIVEFRFQRWSGVVVAVHEGVWKAIPNLSLIQDKSTFEICDQAEMVKLIGGDAVRAMDREVYYVGFSVRLVEWVSPIANTDPRPVPSAG